MLMRITVVFVLFFMIPNLARPADQSTHRDASLTRWKVSDRNRPVPPLITPGTASTPETPGRPPSDAIVLFDGKDLSHWKSGNGGPAGWKVENGYMEITPRTDSISTRDEIGDCQLHIEWATPVPPRGSGQGRGN